MPKSLVVPILAILAAGALVGAAVRFPSAEPAQAENVAAPVLSTRTSPEPPAAPELPALPDGADAIPSLRFRVTTTWQAANGAERRSIQHVTRTAQRIRLELDGLKKEWVFERNSVDPRRVSGYLVDHAASRIVSYEESDLRAEHHLRGWTDALTMRVDLAALRSLRRTSDQMTRAESDFVRYVAPDAARDGLVDIWWSEALLLPLKQRVRLSKVITESTIDRLERLPADTRIDDPRIANPTYRVIDINDSREHRH